MQESKFRGRDHCGGKRCEATRSAKRRRPPGLSARTIRYYGPNPKNSNPKTGGTRSPIDQLVAILQFANPGQFLMKTPGQICAEIAEINKNTDECRSARLRSRRISSEIASQPATSPAKSLQSPSTGQALPSVRSCPGTPGLCWAPCRAEWLSISQARRWRQHFRRARNA